MNINCIICSDLFMPTSEIYVTRCGHIFHYVCLIQWIERSKTCPQCRNKTTDKTINRIYFNILTTEHIDDDAVTLQSKLDALKLQLRLKESHVKATEDKIKEVTDENSSLQSKSKSLKSELEKYKSGLASLKDQINFYKDKAKYVEKVEIEIKQLKDKMKSREEAIKAITGTLEDTNEIVNNCDCPKTLALISSSLKKELLTMEKKRNSLFSTLKRTEDELNACRKEINKLKDDNELLKLDLRAHKQCEAQIQALKKQISEILENPSVANPTLQRVVMESPAPMLTKPKSKLNSSNFSFEDVDSPSVSARIKEIKDSSSPYLNIKSNSMGLLLQKHGGVTKFGSSSTSIFKKSSSTSDIKLKSVPEGSYNGLGGHSKEDKFPTPKPGGIKRTKSSTITSTKFRKLARPANRKLDEFLDISDLD